jgi:hypothetical protein
MLDGWDRSEWSNISVLGTEGVEFIQISKASDLVCHIVEIKKEAPAKVLQLFPT